MHPSRFLSALSFLTRLVPPRVVDDAEFPRTLPWFPATGLAVGVVAVLPSWLGLFSGHPWLQGWLITGLSLWVTRGLHADGLADVADAWGSAATGDRFWAIMKDSRAGPFGVLWLVMAVLGQALAFGVLAGSGRLLAVCWCFVMGRALSVTALALCRSRVRPGLSSLFAPGATAGMAAFALAQAVVLGLAAAPLSSVCLGLVATGLVLAFLTRLSIRQNGFNGDFMGAAIVLGELAAALALLA
ncbi:MAG: adenosylcobinamide-GDP ribazoletransferase [Acidobacteriota bacterium]